MAERHGPKGLVFDSVLYETGCGIKLLDSDIGGSAGTSFASCRGRNLEPSVQMA